MGIQRAFCEVLVILIAEDPLIDVRNGGVVQDVRVLHQAEGGQHLQGDEEAI